MVAVRSVLALTLLRWRLHPVTNSPLRPIASSATSNNTWNVLAWAILCLRVSCTSSTTSLVLQNLNNLLSSGQEELKQSTVMPSELKKFLMLCHWLPSKERLSIKWCSHAYRKRDRTWWQSKWRLNNWSQHGRYNSSFEIPLENYHTSYAAHDVLKAEVKKARVKQAKVRRKSAGWAASRFPSTTLRMRPILNAESEGLHSPWLRRFGAAIHSQWLNRRV